MRKILIIGIGTGNPEHLTIQAVKALNRADVLFIPDKGAEKAELRRVREEICARYIEEPGYRVVGIDVPVRATAGEYRQSVDDWHAVLEERYRAAIETELGEDQCGAVLVWGEPALYDSMLRIVGRIAAIGAGLDYEVLPGISAVQVLAARHRIPLNRIGEPVTITTGRRLEQGLPEAGESVVVMLDGGQALARIPPEDLDVYWGAYLGTKDEIVVAGRLAEVKDEIARVRSRARESKGWIMDTYLLRRRDGA